LDDQQCDRDRDRQPAELEGAGLAVAAREQPPADRREPGILMPVVRARLGRQLGVVIR
jgi:hypothetical protein